MNEAVADSTVLIFLGKLDKLHILKKEHDKVIIPEEVYKEVVEKGKERGAKDAVLVEGAVDDGWVESRETTVLENVERFDLERGEEEVLSLALESNIKEVLADEEAVREAAKLLELKPKGTLYFLLKALKERKIDFDGYLKTLEDLVSVGFYLSEEVYMEAVRKGKKISSH